jgi:phosphoribulokinase
MIAVGGDSGSGKTTLCRGLEKIFGEDRILTICLDDYHSLDRAGRKAAGVTALNPRANNFSKMAFDLWELREGRAVEKPVYDHHDGTLKGPEHIEPHEFIVVQGLFPLYNFALRALFDVAVWLDPELELKVAWKIQRDTAQRGYTEGEVREEIEKRQPDIKAYIDPQAVYADVSVHFHRTPEWEERRDNARLSARIVKRGRFQPLDYREFENGVFRQTKPENEKAHSILELDGRCDDTTARALQDKIWSHMETHAHLRPETLGEFNDASGARISHTLALAQLVIARRVAMVENTIYAKAVS